MANASDSGHSSEGPPSLGGALMRVREQHLSFLKLACSSSSMRATTHRNVANWVRVIVHGVPASKCHGPLLRGQWVSSSAWSAPHRSSPHPQPPNAGRREALQESRQIMTITNERRMQFEARIMRSAIRDTLNHGFLLGSVLTAAKNSPLQLRRCARHLRGAALD